MQGDQIGFSVILLLELKVKHLFKPVIAIITAVVHCHWQKNVETQEIAIVPSNLKDVKLCLALIFDLEYGLRNASMMKRDSINSYNVWTEVNYKSRTLIKKIICSTKLVPGNKKKKLSTCMITMVIETSN